MSKALKGLIQLWDYGWCQHCFIDFPAGMDADGPVEAYFRSPQFGTSFVHPSPGDDPACHGPFFSDAIQPSHFEPIAKTEVLERLRAICFCSGSHPVSSDQWRELERLAMEVISRNELAFELSLSVQDTEIQHDWGWVLEIFHEFIFANKQSKQIERLVIGYD